MGAEGRRKGQLPSSTEEHRDTLFKTCIRNAGRCADQGAVYQFVAIQATVPCRRPKDGTKSCGSGRGHRLTPIAHPQKTHGTVSDTAHNESKWWSGTRGDQRSH